MELLLVLVVVAIIIFALMTRKKTETTGTAAVSFPAKELMNATEQKFYWRLSEALPDHVILCQVALSQMLKKLQGKEAHTSWNRIDRKVCDFVVCDRSFTVIAVIEVDGKEHRKTAQQKRDTVKGDALAAAGYKLLRFPSDALPQAAEIKTALGIIS